LHGRNAFGSMKLRILSFCPQISFLGAFEPDFFARMFVDFLLVTLDIFKMRYFKFGPGCSRPKILCQRCTNIYNKDIPLCIDCFGEFHSNPEEFLQRFKGLG